jgi:hypothetical protein
VRVLPLARAEQPWQRRAAAAELEVFIWHSIQHRWVTSCFDLFYLSKQEPANACLVLLPAKNLPAMNIGKNFARGISTDFNYEQVTLK